MQASSCGDGYSRLSITAHWITAILVIILYVNHEGGRGSTERFVHVSGGAVAGLFLLWRVWHRVRHGMTNRPDQAATLNLASQIVIWGFLAAVVVVVITGYLLPRSVGRPVDMLGLVAVPSPMAANRDVHEFMEEVHEIVGQLFLPLLALHLLGAAKHAFLDRDGVARRMFRSVPSGR